jgi:tRNA A-37 threonylcarbamoyl transferase component Bud32/tetratricopeptide (TPR) repeat protein
MTAGRWDRVKQILGDALDLRPDQRGGFLDQACAGDSELRHDVETLLAGDDGAAPFLDLDRTPERLGPYRIVHEIGRGGMGTVYLAERDDGQFQQRVAIKVIKRGMDTDAVLRRFYGERQIMARLQHPNITRLLDGGMFDGRPYFVMEYLEGEPIVAYCQRTQASIPRRIALALSVCDAVEHAHRNLILHRDLKASNILVDSTGTVKLLDFGIAKLLEADGSTEQTALAIRAMTPQAASPEQVRGEVLTTASDVYSLGVLLYEMLAGKPPYMVASASPAEVARIVCEQPVPKPSAIAVSLRGDLDNILLKALEKESARRYQRAAELADDLRRYLDGLPVQARPGGAPYRARKFVTRNRRALAIAALVLIAITGAVTDAILQGRRAQRRFDDLRQLAGTFLFEFHDAIANLPGATPARELVTRRAVQYLDSLAKEASGDIDLKREVAEGYLRVASAQGLTFESNLGKTADARLSFAKAFRLFESVVAARPNDLGAKTGLARAMLGLKIVTTDSANRLDANQRVIAMMEGAAKSQPLDAPAKLVLGQAWFGLAESLLTRHKTTESIAARQKAIDIFHGLADPEGQRFYSTAEKRLAYTYITELHDPRQGIEHLMVAEKLDRERVAREPSNAVAKLDLALGQAYLYGAMSRKGDLDTALRYLQSAIALRGDVLAVDPLNARVRFFLITDYTRLGELQTKLSHPAEARAALAKGMEIVNGAQPGTLQTPDEQAAIENLRRMAR